MLQLLGCHERCVLVSTTVDVITLEFALTNTYNRFEIAKHHKYTPASTVECLYNYEHVALVQTAQF